MPEREKPAPEPNREQLLQLKNELLERWRRLPVEHQASMALVLLQDVLDSNHGSWLQDALTSQEQTEPIGEAPLLDEETRAQLPRPYTSEGEANNALALAKFVLPGDNRVWYVSAFDGDDLCFGMVVETEINFDYFSLHEIQGLRNPEGQAIRRDPNFTPRTLAELESMHLHQAAT